MKRSALGLAVVLALVLLPAFVFSQNTQTTSTHVARAEVDGVGVPRCAYCPNPSYTDQARVAKVNGSVVLQITVTADGHAENISVLRKLGYGLDQKAVDVVRTWRFQPATGPDGNTVATVVPVEVTFRTK